MKKNELKTKANKSKRNENDTFDSKLVVTTSNIDIINVNLEAQGTLLYNAE